MRFIGRDNDGKVDVYFSAWLGLATVGWAALMVQQGWGDATLQLFFVACGLVPLVLNHVHHRRA